MKYLNPKKPLESFVDDIQAHSTLQSAIVTNIQDTNNKNRWILSMTMSVQCNTDKLIWPKPLL